MDLSIIIPVYNVEKFIRPCIESIFKQGLNENDFEVIIVNDGSTDKSMELIDDIINQHKNITVINQENQGLSVARNNGIAAAKGEYILMPDSDDLFIKNSLKPIIEKAVQAKVDLILADYWPMTNSEIESSSLSMPTISNMVFWEKSGKEMFYEYLKPNYYTVWRTLYKTEFLRQKNLSFVPGIYCQDKPFTHEVYLKADKCLVVSWPIYIYRRHSESISYSMSERYGKDYCICINKMWSLSSNSELSPTLRQKMMDYTYFAFKTLTCRLVHETKDRRLRILIMDYLNIAAPNLSFQNGLKQKICTFLLKKKPHIYIDLRYLYGIIWEDRVGPFIRH
jgi:glycosyltransferase involved in cell wall biosynthesis